MLLEKSQIGGGVSFPSVPHDLLSLPEEPQKVLFHTKCRQDERHCQSLYLKKK